MILTSSKIKETSFLYAWYIKGDPQYVQVTGEKAVTQRMNPHYRIEVLKDIGPNTKIGILSSFNIHNENWDKLCESNIMEDTFYKTKQESLGKLHFMYIKDFGVWKVDGLSVDKKSATIQITRFESTQ